MHYRERDIPLKSRQTHFIFNRRLSARTNRASGVTFIERTQRSR
jgi:hypothetical protein